MKYWTFLFKIYLSFSITYTHTVRDWLKKIDSEKVQIFFKLNILNVVNILLFYLN